MTVKEKRMGDSRTKNAIRNAYFGIISKIVNLLFAFISRTVFIYVLGNTYLGVNGLYSEILSLLSFAELGFGSAMAFSMYKPAAENDRMMIVRLLDFYKTVYRIIAFVIAALGLCLTPFLQYIVKGADWLTVSELRVYFLVYLFNTVIGYFVTYRFTYLNALQKNYIQTNIDSIVNVISYIAQVIAILVWKNFLLYLLINSAVLLISRLVIVVYLNKKYPIFNEKAEKPLSKEEKQPIYKEVRGLAIHQFSSVAVHSTDNILISTMTSQGVTAVGLISNYNMLMNSVLGFVTTLFASVISGFGNLVAASTTERFREVFKQVNFLSFWIYGFCSIAFWILIPPFVTLWIGADKVIDNVTFTLIIINAYLQGQGTAYNNARIAKGNFNKDKWWAVLQAVTNLIVSIVCAKYLGLVGIYIGTVVSRLVYVVFRPFSTYKFLFDESSAEYYKKLLQYIVYVVIAAFAIKFITTPILNNVTIITFILSVCVVCIVPNIIFFLLCMRLPEFKEGKKRVVALIKRKVG